MKVVMSGNRTTRTSYDVRFRGAPRRRSGRCVPANPDAHRKTGHGSACLACDLLLSLGDPGQRCAWPIEKTLKDAGFAVHCDREFGIAPVENLYARTAPGQPASRVRGPHRRGPAGRGRKWRHPPFAGDIADGMLYVAAAST